MALQAAAATVWIIALVAAGDATGARPRAIFPLVNYPTLEVCQGAANANNAAMERWAKQTKIEVAERAVCIPWKSGAFEP